MGGSFFFPPLKKKCMSLSFWQLSTVPGCQLFRNFYETFLSFNNLLRLFLYLTSDPSKTILHENSILSGRKEYELNCFLCGCYVLMLSTVLSWSSILSKTVSGSLFQASRLGEEKKEIFT